jgi:type VI protein secretion system component VasK
MNQWGKFWLIWMSLLAVCSACVAFAWSKFPENKVVQRSQEYVMVGLLTIMGVMIITIFLKLIWHSCRRKSKKMSHGRRAVRYQCPSRDDESNDYGKVRDNVVLTSNHKALERCSNTRVHFA